MEFTLNGAKHFILFEHRDWRDDKGRPEMHTYSDKKRLEFGQQFRYSTDLKRGTSCAIRFQDSKTGPIIALGRWVCHYGDNFNKSMGRTIALTAALKAAKFDRATRTIIWATYWGYINNPPQAKEKPKP